MWIWIGSGSATQPKNDTYPDQQHWDCYQKTIPRFLGVFLTDFSLIEARGLVVDFYVAMKSMVSYSSNLGKGYFLFFVVVKFVPTSVPDPDTSDQWIWTRKGQKHVDPDPEHWYQRTASRYQYYGSGLQ
jgi:hypothetical protein